MRTVTIPEELYPHILDAASTDMWRTANPVDAALGNASVDSPPAGQAERAIQAVHDAARIWLEVYRAPSHCGDRAVALTEPEVLVLAEKAREAFTRVFEQVAAGGMSEEKVADYCRLYLRLNLFVAEVSPEEVAA